LVKETSNVEYIKLIVSCLDYTADDSLARVILHTALTSSIEAGRKWATRFLGILASHEVDHFVDWGMKLMIAQLADPSAKVIRHTLRLLHRWIPQYPGSIHLIKDIQFETFGSAGTLLKAHLFADEVFVKSNLSESLVALDHWKKEFNLHYVTIIEEDVRVALLNAKRSLDGRFARASSERSAKFGVAMPVHLYGQLAQHETGRDILLKTGEADRLLDLLRDSPVPLDVHETSEIKSALYALGHIAAVVDPKEESEGQEEVEVKDACL
uniref:RICTOR_V domain-containing protein n=1 Tax=Gongylonema pulchrum TaxID=637853 RepID=A0A183EH31_9BILA